jgi:hypothetical protein
MSNLSNDNKQQDSKKNLEFWNFTEEGLKFWEKTAFQTSFPAGKLAKSEEMIKINETLKKRLEFFKSSSCYNYLDCYYDYYIKTYNSKTEEIMEKNWDTSFKCLKLFTYCWELEQKEIQNKETMNDF